ncbi:hypothetical protein QZM18_31230 [Burkholderia diffusa]|uniref:DUF7683 domain-containing protein n=1 Tax=Burkholderia diffusa TaxID=488732 RepID=UPI0026552339|nr:hypothetical protein [Burkholderia diffusa]MDN7908562.1 hypothetical protein [Burkholderia diffusa]
MKAYQLHRYISVFEKNGDAHIRDIEFAVEPNLEFLQALFKQPRDNPMYDVGVIDVNIAEELAPYISERLELDSFDYFLECDSV